MRIKIYLSIAVVTITLSVSLTCFITAGYEYYKEQGLKASSASNQTEDSNVKKTPVDVHGDRRDRPTSGIRLRVRTGRTGRTEQPEKMTWFAYAFLGMAFLSAFVLCCIFLVYLTTRDRDWLAYMLGKGIREYAAQREARRAAAAQEMEMIYHIPQDDPDAIVPDP